MGKGYLLQLHTGHLVKDCSKEAYQGHRSKSRAGYNSEKDSPRKVSSLGDLSQFMSGAGFRVSDRISKNQIALKTAA